jgi:hypothetical protein
VEFLSISSSRLGNLYLIGVVNNFAAKSVVNFGETTDKNLAIATIIFGISRF